MKTLAEKEHDRLAKLQRVQARRKASGKRGYAKAVRRFAKHRAATSASDYATCRSMMGEANW